MAKKTPVKTNGMHDSDSSHAPMAGRKCMIVKAHEKTRSSAITTAKVLSHAQAKVSLHGTMMELLSEGDVPRLKQLVSTNLRQGRSLDYILSQIRAAMSGLYNPKGYKRSDHELGLLALRLGGRGLLFALSKIKGVCSRGLVYEKLLKKEPRFATNGDPSFV